MGKANIWKLLGKKKTTKVKSGKTSKSAAISQKYSTANKKISSATGNKTKKTKNNGSSPSTKGTTNNKTNTTGKAETTTPTPTTVKNVYKKGGTAATFGLGAVIGGVGTWLSGLAETIIPETPDEDGLPEQEETLIDDPYLEDDWWGGMNDEAAALLEPLSDVPGVGELVEEAAEGGWSFPLIAGVVVIVAVLGVFAYKKLKPAKKTAGKRKPTTKKGGSKK